MGMFNERERQLEQILVPPAPLIDRDLADLRKAFQEFKAVMEERERLKDQLWKARLRFVALLITSWSITITVLCRLFGVF